MTCRHLLSLLFDALVRQQGIEMPVRPDVGKISAECVAQPRQLNCDTSVRLGDAPDVYLVVNEQRSTQLKKWVLCGFSPEG